MADEWASKGRRQHTDQGKGGVAAWTEDIALYTKILKQVAMILEHWANSDNDKINWQQQGQFKTNHCFKMKQEK